MISSIYKRAMEYARPNAKTIATEILISHAYYRGFVKQKQIDADKACEALYGLMNELGCDLRDIDRAKEYMRNKIDEDV